MTGEESLSSTLREFRGYRRDRMQEDAWEVVSGYNDLPDEHRCYDSLRRALATVFRFHEHGREQLFVSKLGRTCEAEEYGLVESIDGGSVYRLEVDQEDIEELESVVREHLEWDTESEQEASGQLQKSFRTGEVI